jgi:DNA-binding transcriptional MocR family regulator
MLDRGAMITPGDVFVTNGAHEALVLALRATTSWNDVVAVESPTYFGVLQAMEGLGLRALALPTDPRKGVDLNALEQVARDGAVKACVLGTIYQNPLGFTMSDDDKGKAVELLGRHDVPLIEDDVYGFVSIDAPGPAPAKNFDRLGNVIYCGSFSKTLSPALRLGWALPGRFATQFLRQKWLANLSTAMIPQLAVADFLKGNRFRRLMQNSARQYARRVMIMREWVLRCFPSGTKCTAPDGGMVLWVELPDDYDAMSALAQARQDGMSFLPGNIFAASDDYRNFIRLSVSATDEEAIPEVTQRLGLSVLQSERREVLQSSVH